MLITCGLGVPLPEDVPLITGGWLAAKGGSLPLMMVTGLAGILIGDSIIFRAGQTYGDLFKEHELMDEALVARVFSFAYSNRHQVTLESEDLKIQRWDRNPQAQVERALDELSQREVIDTGVILAPNVRFYPVSLDRFITEILDQEFRP